MPFGGKGWIHSWPPEERIRQNTTEKYSYKWPDLAQELLNIICHCLWLLHRRKVAAPGMSLEPYQIPSRHGPTLRYKCNLFRIPGIPEKLSTKQLWITVTLGAFLENEAVIFVFHEGRCALH